MLRIKVWIRVWIPADKLEHSPSVTRTGQGIPQPSPAPLSMCGGVLMVYKVAPR